MKLRIVKILSILFCISCFGMMISCSSVKTSNYDLNMAAMVPAIAPLTADSYDIKGRVYGYGEVSVENPTKGDTLQYGVLTGSTTTVSSNMLNTKPDAYTIAMANATFEMIEQGKAIGADFLLFPNYMVEYTTSGTLKIQASAVAAALVGR